MEAEQHARPAESAAAAPPADDIAPCPSSGSAKRSYKFIDMSEYTREEILHLTEERKKGNHQTHVDIVTAKAKSSFTKDDVLRITPLTLCEELSSMCFFMFGVPGAPLGLSLIGYLVNRAMGSKGLYTYLGVVASLALLPAPFLKDTLTSWWCTSLMRYFSLKEVFVRPLDTDKAYIMVAPPHGGFPFGNIITMIALPTITGRFCRGLGAEATIRLPMYRQILCSMGVISASSSSAMKSLKEGHSVGVSSGGIAEIFETNTSVDGNESIVLRNRKGLARLAIRSGAPLIPSYVFGNTHTLTLLCGGPPNSVGRSVLQRISRSIRFPLMLLFGRFLLPIPYRTPILSVTGPPIEVTQCDKPTDAQIDEVLQRLIDEIKTLFDDHKHAYGWGHKELIVK